MRLIDENSVIESAEKCVFTDKDERKKFLQFVKYCVEQSETAYDVDKVVEELEEKLVCEDFGTCGYCQNRWCPRELLDADEAIEIVRKGGVE